MSFSTLMEALMEKLGGAFPGIVGAVAILFVGWLIALGVRLAVRRGLSYLALNERLHSTSGTKIDAEGGTATAAFWVVFVLALIAFFNTLDLGQVSQPLTAMVEQVLTFLPNVLAAVILGLIAWFLATLFRTLVTRALAATKLDEKLSSEAEVKPLSESLGHVVYGLTFLLFLPAILDVLELNGLLVPVRNVIDKTLGILPNAAAAGVLGLVGWIVARILRNLVTNVLATTGIDRAGSRAGLKGSLSLSGLIGIVVFVLVFVPALIGALDALKIEAISAPATRMLGTMMNAIPNLFAAALVLIVAYLIAEFVAGLARNVLQGVGMDDVPAKLGLPRLLPDGVTLSHLSARLVVILILLFAGVESAKLIGFTRVSEITTLFITFGGQVLLGTLIIGLGLWFANIAYDTIARVSRPEVAALAGLARFTILALVLAMGLQAMGIADQIVMLAFALPLGAVALAAALSFGLGGRKAAGKQMEQWLSRFQDED